MEPSRAQLTRASTFETTNSAAGLADGAVDVDTDRLRHAAVEARGSAAWLTRSRERAGAAAFKSCLLMLMLLHKECPLECAKPCALVI